MELEEEKKKVIVVGMKATPDQTPSTREVLAWTLSNFARPRDHVIALHVALPESGNQNENVNPIAAEVGDSISSGVYEGICFSKEVKVATGTPSIRKALVEEAKLCNATNLILGAPIKHFTLGSASSLAKYCYKRLPPSCLVLVIQSGKIVFQKEGSEKPSIPNKTQIAAKVSGRKGSILQYTRPNVLACRSFNFKRQILQSGCSDSCTDSESISSHTSSHSRLSISSYSSSNSSLSVGDKSLSPEILACSNLNEAEQTQSGTSRGPLSTSSGENCNILNTHVESQALQRKFKLLDMPLYAPNQESPEPGWPLRHKSISSSRAMNPRGTSHRMSVIEWALHLPDRRKELMEETMESPKNDHPIAVSPSMHWPEDRICDGTCSRCVDTLNPAQIQVSSEEKIEHIFSSFVRQNGDLSVTSSLSNTAIKQSTEERVQSVTERLETLCESSAISRFDLEKLKKATSDFSTEKFVGKGGCSEVFEGILEDGQDVAVKCLNLDAGEEFLTEVEILSVLCHPHILPLIGYCVDSHNYLLVYSFISKGTLEHCLHGAKDEFTCLPWNVRVKVAIGVAEALEYLHDESPRHVIHRDVKSSNILLSTDFEPQLTDFGLAKWAPTSSSYLSCSDVVGTFGYLAPEYFMYGRVNEKTDVYSFGVVLLELLTGRKPIDTTKPKGQENLVMWARPLLEKGNHVDLVDAKLEGTSYDVCEVKNMMMAANACLRRSAPLRPCMKQVLKLLRGEEGGDNEGVGSIEVDEGYDMAPGQHGDCDIRTHLRLALLGVDDDMASQAGTTDQSSPDDVALSSSSKKFLQDYLDGWYSRSSSFDQ